MLKPIKNKKEHESYLARSYDLIQMELKPNSKESDELEVISILIEAYEKEHYPIEDPNPIHAILFRLDQLGKKRSDLNEVLGSRSRVSEILSGKRKLSLKMIRRLNKKLGISAQTLINDYEPILL